MAKNLILEELRKNKKNQRIGSEVFGVPINENSIKRGLPVKDIISEMKKASKENLFQDSPSNATFC